MTEFNDFGFSIVDETELDSNTTLVGQINDYKKLADEYKNRLDNMHKAVIPLLLNLKSNPEKDMIHWPNRIDKIEEFEAKLENIKNGKA